MTGAGLRPLSSGGVLEVGLAPSALTVVVGVRAVAPSALGSSLVRDVLPAPRYFIGVSAHAMPAICIWCRFRFPSLVVCPGVDTVYAPGLMLSAARRCLALAPSLTPAPFVASAASLSPPVSDALNPPAPGRTEDLLHRRLAPPASP